MVESASLTAALCGTASARWRGCLSATSDSSTRRINVGPLINRAIGRRPFAYNAPFKNLSIGRQRLRC